MFAAELSDHCCSERNSHEPDPVFSLVAQRFPSSCPNCATLAGARADVERLEDRQLLSVTVTNGLPSDSPNYFAAVIDRGGSSEQIVYGQQADTVYEYAGYFEIGGRTYALESVASNPTLTGGEVLGHADITLPDGKTVAIDIRSRVPSGSGLLITEYAVTASAGVDLRTAKFCQYLDADIGSASDDVLTVSGSVATNDLNLKTIDPGTKIESSQLLQQALIGCRASGFGAQYYSSLRSAIQSGSYDPPPEGKITLSTTTVPDIGPAYGPGDITTAIVYSFTNASSAVVRTAFSNYDFVVNEDVFRVSGTSPDGVLDGSVHQIQVLFSRDVDTRTVDASDFALVGPAGVVPITGLQWISPNHLALAFDPLTTPGDYLLYVYPTIADTSGQLLNQDGDATAGETLDDRYQTAFVWDTVSPYVFYAIPWNQTGTPVSAITLYFSEDIDPQSVTNNSVLALTAPDGTDLRARSRGSRSMAAR